MSDFDFFDNLEDSGFDMSLLNSIRSLFTSFRSHIPSIDEVRAELNKRGVNVTVFQQVGPLFSYSRSDTDYASVLFAVRVAGHKELFISDFTADEKSSYRDQSYEIHVGHSFFFKNPTYVYRNDSYQMSVNSNINVNISEQTLSKSYIYIESKTGGINSSDLSPAGKNKLFSAFEQVMGELWTSLINPVMFPLYVFMCIECERRKNESQIRGFEQSIELSNKNYQEKMQHLLRTLR